jgi:hypothetical protein
MTPELFGMLKALAGGSTLALLLMIIIVFLWRDNKAKDRCKSPEKDACGVCNLCVSRAHSSDLDKLGTRIIEQGVELASAVKDQEAKHAEEIKTERERGDKLQDENKKTLRELMDFFKDGDHSDG